MADCDWPDGRLYHHHCFIMLHVVSNTCINASGRRLRGLRLFLPSACSTKRPLSNLTSLSFTVLLLHLRQVLRVTTSGGLARPIRQGRRSVDGKSERAAASILFVLMFSVVRGDRLSRPCCHGRSFLWLLMVMLHRFHSLCHRGSALCFRFLLIF